MKSMLNIIPLSFLLHPHISSYLFCFQVIFPAPSKQFPGSCYAFRNKYLHRSRFEYFSILLQKQSGLVHYLKLAFSSYFYFFICSNSKPNIKTLISLEKQIVCFNRRRRWFCNKGINWIKDKV